MLFEKFKIYILVVVLSFVVGGLTLFFDFIVNLLDAYWTISLVQLLAFYNIPLQVLFASFLLLFFYLYNIKSGYVEQRDALKSLGMMGAVFILFMLFGMVVSFLDRGMLLSSFDPEIVSLKAQLFEVALHDYAIWHFFNLLFMVFFVLFCMGLVFVWKLDRNMIKESFKMSYLIVFLVYLSVLFFYIIGGFSWVFDLLNNISGHTVAELEAFHGSEVFFVGHLSMVLVLSWFGVFSLVLFFFYISYFGYRGLIVYCGNKVLPVSFITFFLFGALYLGSFSYFFDWLREMTLSLWLEDYPQLMMAIHPLKCWVKDDIMTNCSTCAVLCEPTLAFYFISKLSVAYNSLFFVSVWVKMGLMLMLLVLYALNLMKMNSRILVLVLALFVVYMLVFENGGYWLLNFFNVSNMGSYSGGWGVFNYNEVIISASFSNMLFKQEWYMYLLLILLLVLTLMVFMFSTEYLCAERLYMGEYFMLMLLALFGMMILLLSNDFLTMYLALELQSLSLYVLASIKSNKMLSLEAGLKYFATGSFSSGLLVFGISLMYGLLGSTNYTDFVYLLSPFALDYGLAWYYLALYLMLAGLLFKLAAFPFYSWAPDVYEGAPTSVTFFFMMVPKVAFVGFLMKMVLVLCVYFWSHIQFMFVMVAVGSLMVGTFGALFQVKVKRLLAYSGIVHVGYMLIAVSFGALDSFFVAFNYLMIYLILSVSTFSVLLVVRKLGSLLLFKNISEFALLSSANPAMAWVFTLVLFSLAGVPPLVGFFGKFFLFYNLSLWSNFSLFLFVLVMSVVGAVYYIRLIQIMFFKNIRVGASTLSIPQYVGVIITMFSYLNIGGLYLVQFFKFY